MKRQILFFIALWLTATLQAQRTDISRELFELPDVIFKAIEAPEGFVSAYELRVRQPLDHGNPEGAHFYQRVYLSHRSFDKPMVIATEGYQRPANRMYELTELIGANQLDVEHRFFGASVPDSLDYSYLTLEQATADLHKIRVLLGALYQGHWVSTGISKGGQTTIYYRYFYPEDVTASVPYVAPLNLELEEPRIYDFLGKVGTRECRDKIFTIQKRMLRDRDEFLMRIKWYSKGAKLSFDYLGLEKAFEYAVLEYPFSFWQWGHDCAKIPDPNAPVDEVLEHFIEVSNVDFFSDRDIHGYASHYYQAADQMGYYGYDIGPFKKWLKALPKDRNPSAIFTPGKMEVDFDGSLARAVYDWLAEEGDRFIHIYGELDTWSATAVPHSERVDALWIYLEGKDHGGARIKNMTESQRAAMVEKLEGWLSMEIK